MASAITDKGNWDEDIVASPNMCPVFLQKITSSLFTGSVKDPRARIEIVKLLFQASACIEIILLVRANQTIKS